MKKGWVFGLGITILFLLAVGFFSKATIAQQGFSVNNLLLKVSVKEGDVAQRSFVISSEKGGEFSVNSVGIEGIEISESNFALAEGESKDISVIFDSFGMEKGVYVGNIKISGASKTVILPVIIEVESLDVFFDVNLDVSPQYSSVHPGGQFVAHLKVFDLISGGVNDGLGASSVQMNYYLYDTSGNLVSSETESAVVEKQTQFTKTINIPEDLEEGDYVFAVSVSYASSVGSSTYLFSIGSSSFGSSGISFLDGLDANLIAILGVIIIIFAGFLIAFLYLAKGRDRMFYELKKYHNWELKKQSGILAAQGRVVRTKKGVSEKEVKKQIDREVEKLKLKQERRNNEFVSLKKKGDMSAMKHKLNEWKKEGYTLGNAEYKLRGLSVSEMKKIMAEWKGK